MECHSLMRMEQKVVQEIQLYQVCVGGLLTVLALEPNYCVPSSFREVPMETQGCPVSGYS